MPEKYLGAVAISHPHGLASSRGKKKDCGGRLDRPWRLSFVTVGLIQRLGAGRRTGSRHCDANPCPHKRTVHPDPWPHTTLGSDAPLHPCRLPDLVVFQCLLWEVENGSNSLLRHADKDVRSMWHRHRRPLAAGLGNSGMQTLACATAVHLFMPCLFLYGTFISPARLARWHTPSRCFPLPLS